MNTSLYSDATRAAARAKLRRLGALTDTQLASRIFAMMPSFRGDLSEAAGLPRSAKNWEIAVHAKRLYEVETIN